VQYGIRNIFPNSSATNVITAKFQGSHAELPAVCNIFHKIPIPTNTLKDERGCLKVCPRKLNKTKF
jgi:hypothetical protein